MFISFKTKGFVTVALKLVFCSKIDALFTFLSFPAAKETPTITLQNRDKVTIVKGNVLYLFCKAEGYPKPLVTWRKDGKLLQGSVNETDFIVYDAKKNDAGKYECEASNSVGTVSHTVEVTIQGKVTFLNN